MEWKLTDEDIHNLSQRLPNGTISTNPWEWNAYRAIASAAQKKLLDHLASQPYKCPICGKDGEPAGCFSCAEQEWTTRIMHRLASKCGPEPCDTCEGGEAGPACSDPNAWADTKGDACGPYARYLGQQQGLAQAEGTNRRG